MKDFKLYLNNITEFYLEKGTRFSSTTSTFNVKNHKNEFKLWSDDNNKHGEVYGTLFDNNGTPLRQDLIQNNHYITGGNIILPDGYLTQDFNKLSISLNLKDYEDTTQDYNIVNIIKIPKIYIDNFIGLNLALNLLDDIPKYSFQYEI